MRNRKGIILTVLLGLVILSLLFWIDKSRNLGGDTESNLTESEFDLPKLPVENTTEIDSLVTKDVAEANKEVTPSKPTPEVERSLSEVKLSAWIPSWGHDKGIEELLKSSDSYSVIMPVWYSVNPDGSLVDRRPANWASLVNSFDGEIIPSIGVFDAEVMSKILSSQKNLANHIKSIIGVVDEHQYDGIDIDYEMIYLNDGEKYITFLEQLTDQLDIRGKTLSVTLLPQWGKDIVYTSLPETREVQDFGTINKIADQIRLMTYDYTPSSSNTPGPIAPIDWIDNVLRYATTQIDPEKLWLGIHLYGYHWYPGNAASAVSFNKYQAEYDTGNISTNEVYQEGYYEYDCDTEVICSLYIQTPEGVEERINLASKYRIAGVAFWRIGDNGNLLQKLYK